MARRKFFRALSQAFYVEKCAGGAQVFTAARDGELNEFGQ